MTTATQDTDDLLQQIQGLQADNAQLHQTLQDLQTSVARWTERRNQEMHAEALEQKKAEILQRVFYRIAERATAGLPFFDFLQTVHSLLGELLYAKNCFVALQNNAKNTLDFPYYIDEKDGDSQQVSDVPLRKGLTEYVLRNASPQLIDAARFAALQQSGEITEATGDLSFTTWLGVPLKINGNISGVLAVQSYEADSRYNEQDADVLMYVANHVSAAIERYRALDSLRSSEAMYRSLFENLDAGVGVGVIQKLQLVYASPSMEKILGNPLEQLLSRPFAEFIYPPDLDSVVQRHSRRLQGEALEPRFRFRVVTETGEIRTLELSAVTIPWNQRKGTLMFLVDTTARLEAEQNQRTVLKQQTELNDLKSRFITMASHEFRTPLAAIHGSVELLMHYETRMSVEKKQLVLAKIDDAVERMTHMLENVLLIGRTGAGQLQFKPRPLALTVFCNGLLDELRGAMENQLKRVHLEMELPASDSYYLLDDTLIRNIVGNLLSNAIKYSPRGGNVHFAIREVDSTLVITVSDQGIGIPLADQQKLFESFHRASNVGAIAGTGLGLSIVKEAVSCHQGSISVSSTEGQGSVFTVVLPTVPETQPVSAA